MRAVFFGSPDFAVPSLDALTDIAEVCAVVCQPDKPAGRGLTMRPPAVKVRAEALGLPVWQPTKMRTGDLAERLRALEADVGVVVAYGRILPRAVLDAPKHGCVNVHASLLPRWRGASPIQHAILAGDAETGVTLMQMDEGMDTGPMLAEVRTPIEPEETGGALFERLAPMGAALLRAELAGYVAGDLTPKPQPTEGVTMASLLSKSDGAIRWSETATQVHDRVRAMSPWPGAFTALGGERLKVHRVSVLEAAGSIGGPGEVLDRPGLAVACGTGAVSIEEVQEAGRKRQPATTYMGGRGRDRLAPGTQFDTEPAQ